MELSEYTTMALLEDSYWWYVGLKDLVHRALTSGVSGSRVVHALDAGCGTGARLVSLSEIFPGSLVVGMDIAKAAIDYAARKQKGHVVCGSANRLPFQAGTFDVGLCIDVLDVQGVEERVALQEIHRVLRPGGLLILNVPAFESLRGTHDAAVHRRHRYQRGELRQALTQHGFAVEKLIYWNALLFPLVFVVRRWLRPGNGTVAPRSDLWPLPQKLNRFLTALLAMDIRICTRINLPFGTSLFGIASKLP